MRTDYFIIYLINHIMMIIIASIQFDWHINTSLNSINVSKKKFVPPTVEEVRAYCQERGNKVDPQAFVDHYTSNGWMVGKNKMKSWKAAVGTWERSSWQSREAPAQKKYNANKGMMTSNYGDMSEFEKSMLAN